MKENEDYELVPSEVGDHWDVRILTGDYIETVFNFGAIKVSDDGESLNYSAEIKAHQFGEDWDPDEDMGWHETTGNILLNILERSIENDNPDNGTAGGR